MITVLGVVTYKFCYCSEITVVKLVIFTSYFFLFNTFSKIIDNN